MNIIWINRIIAWGGISVSFVGIGLLIVSGLTHTLNEIVGDSSSKILITRFWAGFGLIVLGASFPKLKTKPKGQKDSLGLHPNEVPE